MGRRRASPDAVRVSPEAEAIHSGATIIDLHVHPQLKTFLFGYDFAEKHDTPKYWWPLTLTSDLPRLLEGGINAIVSTVYLPEKNLLTDCKLLNALLLLFPKVRAAIQGNPFNETVKRIDEFEQVVTAARIDGNKVAEIAHSKLELQQILAAGKLAIVHSIEGGHSVEGNPEYVKQLYDRGVCLMTLGHFYENETVQTVDAIPQKYKLCGCFKMPHDETQGLKPAGIAVVKKMIELGMIIDLTHSTKKARTSVYQINAGRRPLVMSHVGVQKYFQHEMNADPDDISNIKACNGVIGVIFFDYWLCGNVDQANGIELIVNTIQEICATTGSTDNVAIGTDFDGFTDPPDDLKDPSELPLLTEALLKAKFTGNDIKKIYGGNVLRVLNQGWGK